jgi:serine protease Do
MTLRRRVHLALACAIIVAAAFGGCVPSPSVSAAPQAAPNAGLQPTPETARLAAPFNLPDFAALVEATGASVVNISITQLVRGGPEQYGIEPGSPLYEFFRRYGIPWGRPVPQQGIGSGFIVSADGQILTNAHVVAEATEVLVRLTDKRQFKARVLGVDRKTDVALIKIDARGLPAVRIGDPAKARVGEWVAAIGSPFGFENSVTAGIISAKARHLPDEDYVPFIQTDVAVNPGNSGGPLFNMAGEVIGINSLIFSGTGGYMGLSFAIPIDVAMKVKEDLLAHGKVRRGRIGVGVQSITEQLAESFGMKKTQGALVTMVEPGGPADRAGIRVGDVILAVGEREVAQSADLPAIVGETAPGKTIALRIWRNGAPRELRVTVGEAPAEQAAGGFAPPEGRRLASLGVVVRPLSEEESRQIQTRGLLVLDVAGPAAAAGVQPGDVILAVNNEPVASVEQLRAQIVAARGRVALLIQRGEARVFVPVIPD